MAHLGGWSLLAAIGLALVPGVARSEPDPAPAAAPAPAAETAPSATPAAPSTKDAWCAPSFETLADDVCFAAGPAGARRTLVIFLHGLVDDGAGWQHAQQIGMARAGQRLGFSVLAPRGRNGVGPNRREGQIAWPTAEEMRKNVEDELVRSWESARRTIETRQGAPFDEVFVLGFSNGAYYGSSLALRGRLDVDGYGVFAGGSAPKGMDRVAKATKNRKPVFVGVATKDKTKADGRALVGLLSDVGWPHSSSSKKVGHVVADAQLTSALAYLRGTVDRRKGKADAPAPEPVAKKAAPKKRPKKTASKKGR